MSSHQTTQGFTLIELSIVLVIIGLIVGGVLVGQDLVQASKIRSTISQLESYKVATNTFRLKYNALPGDIEGSSAAGFGLETRNGGQGRGDNNKIIQQPKGWATHNPGTGSLSGELGLFWRDLSETNLIAEQFNSATQGSYNNSLGTTPWEYFLPKSPLGENYFYIWSGGQNTPAGESNGVNYWGLSGLNNAGGAWFYTKAGLRVIDAWKIDAKIDDGLPQSGVVNNLRAYHAIAKWSRGGPHNWAAGPSPGTASNSNALSCHDNDNNAATAMHYSVDYEEGNNINCSLTFVMQ